MAKTQPSAIRKKSTIRTESKTPIHKTSPQKFKTQFPKVSDGARAGLSDKEFHNMLKREFKKSFKVKPSSGKSSISSGGGTMASKLSTGHINPFKKRK